MRYRQTIGAALIFAALLGWVLTRERGRVPEKGEVFGLDVKQVTRLEVTPEHGKPFTLEKRGDQWWITAPFEGWADKDEVERMARTLCELKPDKRPDEDPNKPEYGLDKPVLTVRLWYDGGKKKIELALGKETPVGSQRFARISGHKGLYLVSSFVKTDLEKKPEDLRDKKLAHYDKDKVTRIELQDTKGRFVLASESVGDKKEWQLVEPIKTKADRWSVDTLVNRPEEVEAKAFEKLPKNLASVGLDKPRATLTLSLADGKKVVLRVGKKVKKKVKKQYSEEMEEQEVAYVQTEGRPELLLVEATFADDLDKDLMGLRDKHVLDIDRAEVTGLRVQRKKGLDFAVAKRGDTWYLDSPEPGKAKQTKVDDLLWDLEDLETSEFIEHPKSLREYGLEVPQIVVTLQRSKGGPVKISFGDKTKEGRYYCKVSDKDTVYVVSDLLISALPEKVEDIKAEEK